MEVMSMSLDTLMRDTVEPFPEYVLGKIAVSVCCHSLNLSLL